MVACSCICVFCTATDAAGNTDTCRFSVVVKQLPDPCPGCSTNLPPMNFSCPMVIDLRSYLATNLPNFAATCVPPSGSVFPLGTNAITCTYTNARGVVTNFAFTITIADTKAPTLTCPADITIAADPGRTNIAVNFSATGRDDCSAVSLTYSKAPGSMFPMGQTTVIVTGRDSAGNSATCSFNVTVIDNRLYLPTTNLTRNTDAGLCSAVVTYPFGSLPPGHIIVCNPPSGTTFAKGATTVRCTATNPSGRSTNASFTVTVLDKELPVLTIPTNMVISCASEMKSTKRIEKTSAKKDNKRDDTDDDQDGEKDDNRVTWTTTATDNCPGISVVCVPASGSIFTNGTTVVRCTATDASSNQATASFQVKLTDLTPPVITSLKASPSNLWPPNHKMVAVKLTVKATDACGPVTSRIVSVSSNQPLNGTGDGNTDIDWAITGPLTVNLRAERAGNAVRIYTIIVESKDAAGNTTTRSAQVYVDHNKSTSDTTTDKSKDSPPVNQLMK